VADETWSIAALIPPIALAELPRQPQNARPSGANRASISFELELTLEGNFSGNIFRCGLSYPLGDEKNSMSSNVPSVSGTEDHEPEHAQDQDREAGGGYKQGEHREGPGSACRAWVGVRRSDVAVALPWCLDFLDVVRILDAGCQGNA